MQLHQLRPKHAPTRKKTRVGRGGKRGTSSGHGTKGQKSRAGHRIRPAERDYIQRLPKLRGHRNNPKSPKLAVVNVSDLEKLIDGNVVDASALPKTKILGNGNVKKAFEIKGVPLSESAKKKIEAAGGKVHESR
ncbi:MAG: uL15 family ribosomal protein [bacterium]|nr:uL15 family ribosomal protein [bacterium]